MADFKRPNDLKHTTNHEWEITDLELDPENSWAYRICQLLYGRTSGYAKIGLYNKHRFYATRALRDPNMVSSIIGSRRYSRNNTVMSIATYRSDKDGTQKNLKTINAVCIDVDISSSRNLEIAGMDTYDAVKKFYFDFVENKIIPAPTYIEYGRNFRLVYVLDRPFYVPKSESKRKSILTLFKRIIQCLSETIQSCEDWGVDKKYNPTPYVRVPASKNVRWDDFDPAAPYPSSVHVINIAEDYSTMYLWDIQELIEYVLPDKPAWYDPWKETSKKKNKGKKKSKEKSTAYTASLETLCNQRMADLETLQALGWDTGYREAMTYLYRLTALQSGMIPDQALEAAQRFNAGFAHPLDPHRVITQCKPSNVHYRYKNSTIREELGLGENDYPNLFAGNGLSRHERYEADKRKQIADGKLIPKKQRLEEIYSRIISLQQSGMSRKEIETTLGIPQRTMTRYLKTIRESVVQ